MPPSDSVFTHTPEALISMGTLSLNNWNDIADGTPSAEHVKLTTSFRQDLFAVAFVLNGTFSGGSRMELKHTLRKYHLKGNNYCCFSSI